MWLIVPKPLFSHFQKRTSDLSEAAKRGRKWERQRERDCLRKAWEKEKRIKIECIKQPENGDREKERERERESRAKCERICKPVCWMVSSVVGEKPHWEVTVPTFKTSTNLFTCFNIKSLFQNWLNYFTVIWMCSLLANKWFQIKIYEWILFFLSEKRWQVKVPNIKK